MYICICIYVRMYTCTRICVYIYVYIYIFVCSVVVYRLCPNKQHLDMMVSDFFCDQTRSIVYLGARMMYLLCICHAHVYAHVLAQQTCMLCHTADVSTVSHSRHVCCATQQTCLPCHQADMSAVSRSRIPNKVITLFWTSANSQETYRRDYSDIVDKLF